MSQEVWKPIQGFPGYAISNQGRVASSISRKGVRDPFFVLNIATVRGHHKVVYLYRDKMRFTRSMNALMKAHFGI
jgi:hypothetical protein